MADTTKQTVEAFHAYLDQVLACVGSGEVDPATAGSDIGLALRAWVENDPSLGELLDIGACIEE